MKKEIELAKITITVKRRRRPYLIPGWQYGTSVDTKPCRSGLTTKDQAIVAQVEHDVRKAI